MAWCHGRVRERHWSTLLKFPLQTLWKWTFILLQTELVFLVWLRKWLQFMIFHIILKVSCANFWGKSHRKSPDNLGVEYFCRIDGYCWINNFFRSRPSEKEDRANRCLLLMVLIFILIYVWICPTIKSGKIITSIIGSTWNMSLWCCHSEICLNRKGVFNLSNQLSNFSKNWGMKHDKTAFREFHGEFYRISALHVQK